MSKSASIDKTLPLFEYAQRFEDFETYDGFNSFFIYCIHTCGFRKSEIAQAMLLSDSGLSIRMNEVNPELPRFNADHVQRYVDFTKDPRPWQYLKWRQEKATLTKEITVKEMIGHLNSEMKRLNNLLEGK